jgi:hypothetical protein
MSKRSIALAAFSTALGIAVVQASEAVSAFISPARPSAERPRVPCGYAEAEVDRVIATDSGPVVLVRRTGRGGDEALPIWVGAAEGRAISRGLLGADMPRPMTHDLLASTVDELGAEVHHVRVDHLRPDGVYVGTVALETPEGPVTIDARPSDALALALRVDAPVYLARGLDAHMLTLGD